MRIGIKVRAPRKHNENSFICKFCGAPSYIDPYDQVPPPDYCHESDHGEWGTTEHWASALVFFCFGVSAGAVTWGIFA